MPRPFLRAIVLALPIAIALSACGGSSSSTSAGSSGGLNGKPIKIASISGLSGGVSSNPEYADGAQAAVSAINAKGGVNGRPLQLQMCDNHQNATDSANCYRKILSDKDVVALVSGSDNYRDPVKAQVEAAKIPVIGQWPISTFDITNPMSFNVNGSVVVGFDGLAHDIVDSGAKTIGLVSLDLPTTAVINKTIYGVMQAAGVKVINDVKISPTTADLSAPAQQVTRNNPDAIIWLTFAAATPTSVKAVRATGYKGIIGISGASFNQQKMLEMGAGGQLDVGLVLPPAWDTSTKYGAQYNQDMKTYAPKGTVDELGLTSWLGVQLFAQAVTSQSSIDRSSVLAGVKRLSAVETGGLTPPINFAAKSTLPFVGIYNPAYTSVHVVGGKVDWDGKLHEFGTGKVLTPST
jgi:branched-chain amino acid transport system substrate-binding protein